MTVKTCGIPQKHPIFYIAFITFILICVCLAGRWLISRPNM